MFACSLFSALQKNSHASRSKLQEREEVCEPFVVCFRVYSDYEFEQASRMLSERSVAFRHTALDYGYQVR